MFLLKTRTETAENPKQVYNLICLTPCYSEAGLRSAQETLRPEPDACHPGTGCPREVPCDSGDGMPAPYRPPLSLALLRTWLVQKPSLGNCI